MHDKVTEKDLDASTRVTCWYFTFECINTGHQKQSKAGRLCQNEAEAVKQETNICAKFLEYMVIRHTSQVIVVFNATLNYTQIVWDHD